MPLTSVRLIMLAAVLTLGAIAATVLVWRRWGRWRFLVRPLGVLLIEALLVLTAGLAVNRSEEFYPSWAALVASSDPKPASYQTSAGHLDGWLAAQPSLAAFPWRPTGWTDWHLAAAPTVTVPADYLQHPTLRYSAVLVLGARAWTLPPLSGPTVLVNVETTAATPASVLAEALPGSLGRDLRVTSHRWALVTSAADNALARQVVTASRGRFPALAFVGTTAPGSPAPKPPAGASHPGGTGKTGSTAHGSKSAHPSSTGTATKPAAGSTAKPPAGKPPVSKPAAGGAVQPQHGAGSVTPSQYDSFCTPAHGATTSDPAHPQRGAGTTTAGGTGKTGSATHSPTAAPSSGAKPPATVTSENCPTVALPPGVLPAGIQTAYFPAPAGKTGAVDLAEPLKAALSWASSQTPPPLAASAPEPTYLPPAPKRPHKPKSKTKPKSKAVKHGTGQPRS